MSEDFQDWEDQDYGRSKQVPRRASGACGADGDGDQAGLSVAMVGVDAGDRPGVTTEQAAEVARLKRENPELRRANEILKAAAIFFGAELERPGRR